MPLKEFTEQDGVFLYDPEGKIYKPVEEDGEQTSAKFVWWENEKNGQDRLIILPPNWTDGRPLLHGNGFAVDLNGNQIFGYETFLDRDSTGAEHQLPVAQWEHHYRMRAAGSAVINPEKVVIGPRTQSKTYQIQNPESELKTVAERLGTVVDQALFDSLKS